MILLDLNVLIAAHREDHPHHASVRPWFDRLAAGDDQFTVPDVVWSGFVRVATNRRVFTDPSTVQEAFDFVDAVRG